MAKGIKLDVVAYFEGVNVPVISVSISSTSSLPSIATIDIPYTTGVDDIMPTTHVAIFYSDSDNNNVPYAAIDRYKLLFHGEVTSTRIQRNATNMTWQVYAVDSRSYLNRMPSQFAWFLVADDFNEYADDYNFYGLPVDKNNDAASSWFENITQLQVIRPQSYSGGGSGNDKYALSLLQLTSKMGMRARKVNGVPSVYPHEGEDFAPRSSHDAHCNLYSPWNGKIEVQSYQESGYGYWVRIRKSSGEYIELGHMAMHTPYAEQGDNVGEGQWIGVIGNSGDSSGTHVHIKWHRDGSEFASADINDSDRFRGLVQLTQDTGNADAGIGRGYTAEGKDMMMRLLAYGKYRGKAYQGSGDISKGEPAMSSSGGNVDIGRYPLEQYISGLLELLATCDGQHLYYRNANTRFNIKKSHSAKDYADQFRILWGADYYVSYMGKEYRNMSKYKYTTADNMYSALRSIGYISTSTTSPKYDPFENKLNEYLITVDRLWHKPPMFNYINVEEEDSLSYSGKRTPVTALRYKTGINGIFAIITDSMSPSNALLPLGGMQLLRSEQLYGINRVSQEMDYFLRMYIDEFGLEYESQGLYQRTIDYDREMKSTGSDTVEVSLHRFEPGYVVGMPTAVYSKDLDVEYDGVIKSIDLYINVNSGSCQTRVVVQNPSNSEDPYYDGASRGGISPGSKVDREIAKDSDKFYKEQFYPAGIEESVVVQERKLDYSSVSDKQKKRDICTMRQYLTVCKHKNIGKLSLQNSISTINDLSLTSDDKSPSTTFEINATKKLTISKMSDIYIKERYEIVRNVANKIKGNRIIVINE